MRNALLALAALTLVPRKARWLLLRAVGINTQAWNIGPRCVFTGDITIGKGTYINRECLFDGFAPIRIGGRCAIGMRAMFITSTHQPGDGTRRAGEFAKEPVTVGDGCWVGAQVLVMPGVTVGEGCVIAAGAVVTKDCDPHTLYAGVPAKAVRAL